MLYFFYIFLLLCLILLCQNIYSFNVLIKIIKIILWTFLILVNIKLINNNNNFLNFINSHCKTLQKVLQNIALQH